MTPGDYIIYRCPNCSKKVYSGSLISWNTFGEKIYSDGKRVAPMLPIYPYITQCPECGILFKLKGSNKIGTSDFWDGDIELEFGKDVAPANHLSIQGNLKAIEQEFYDDMCEIDFRIKIWHIYNDRVRKGESLFKDNDDEKIWEENLHQLLDMLDVDSMNEMIMMAEINRNLGKFDECMNLINNITNTKMDCLKEKFQNACMNQNTLVFELG